MGARARPLLGEKRPRLVSTPHAAEILHSRRLSVSRMRENLTYGLIRGRWRRPQACSTGTLARKGRNGLGSQGRTWYRATAPLYRNGTVPGNCAGRSRPRLYSDTEPAGLAKAAADAEFVRHGQRFLRGSSTGSEKGMAILVLIPESFDTTLGLQTALDL